MLSSCTIKSIPVTPEILGKYLIELNLIKIALIGYHAKNFGYCNKPIELQQDAFHF